MLRRFVNFLLDTVRAKMESSFNNFSAVRDDRRPSCSLCNAPLNSNSVASYWLLVGGCVRQIRESPTLSEWQAYITASNYPSQTLSSPGLGTSRVLRPGSTLTVLRFFEFSRLGSATNLLLTSTYCESGGSEYHTASFEVILR
jgi:hypothetical protein